MHWLFHGKSLVTVKHFIRLGFYTESPAFQQTYFRSAHRIGFRFFPLCAHTLEQALQKVPLRDGNVKFFPWSQVGRKGGQYDARPFTLGVLSGGNRTPPDTAISKRTG